MLAVSAFISAFGQGVFGGARANFFVDTLGLSGTQVLWLEGLREIPGLLLIFIAALLMFFPVAKRGAAAMFLMGLGFALYATVQSYAGLILIAILASMGNHMWMPLPGVIGMSLAPRENSGQVMGVLRSVGALAAIAGIGLLALVSLLAPSLSLRVYYIVGGCLIMVAGLMLLRLPDDIGAPPEKRVRLLLSRRYWLYYVLNFFEGSRKQVLYTFATLYLVDQFQLPVWQISTILLVSAITNLFLAPVLGSMVDRHGESKMLTISYALLVLFCLCFGFVNSPLLLAILVVAIRAAIMLGMALSTYVNRKAPEEELDPTLSAGISINHVTSVAMPLVAGSVLPLIGYKGVFIGTAVLIALSIPFAMALKVESGRIPVPASAE